MSLELINSISNGDKTLSEMTREELIEMHNISIANSDFRALRIATNEFTGLYDYDEHKPYWLCSEFQSPIWNIEISTEESKQTYKLSLDWRAVVLNDGKLLTDHFHAPLLLAFKYWVTATNNPRHNGGKQNKGLTIYRKINHVRTLINAILLHGNHIKLSERHLSGLTQEFLLDIFIKFAKAGNYIDGIYGYTERVSRLLRQNTDSISDDTATSFATKYPHITRHLTEDEQSLGLSRKERIKACCWLHSIGYYKRNNGTMNTSGNQVVLFPYLYYGKILPIHMTFPVIDELKLQSTNTRNEYRAVPNKDLSKEISEGQLLQHFHVLRLLHSLNGKTNVSICPAYTLTGINIKRIQQHTRIKISGRYRTLPITMVFELIRKTYEFTKTNQDIILKSVLSIVTKAQTKSTQSYSNPNYIDSRYKGYTPDLGSSERQEWIQTQALEFIAPELAELGVDKVRLLSTTEGFFTLRRNTPSLLCLYNVLIGSLQILTGVIMAKRQGEMINLKSHGNLEPNIDPASTKGLESEFFLKAKLKKSGYGGQFGRNATIKRPIPRAFALLIWKLEQFNQAMIKAKCNRNTLSLFNLIVPHSLKIIRCDSKSYNKHLDNVCDYFETPLVDFGDGDIRRYYVRQHQLRRFFAMVFFWSKGFDGLDSLRWMLGHTDVEHLHHYITESESGDVLNGVKASYLRDAIKNDRLENIDRLRKLIAKRYRVNPLDISLNSTTDAASIYDDTEEYKTLPKIETLKKQEQLESHILELLNENVIALEPEFFSIYQGDRKINDFSLTLKINELG